MSESHVILRLVRPAVDPSFFCGTEAYVSSIFDSCAQHAATKSHYFCICTRVHRVLDRSTRVSVNHHHIDSRSRTQVPRCPCRHSPGHATRRSVAFSVICPCLCELKLMNTLQACFTSRESITASTIWHGSSMRSKAWCFLLILSMS